MILEGLSNLSWIYLNHGYVVVQPTHTTQIQWMNEMERKVEKRICCRKRPKNEEGQLWAKHFIHPLILRRNFTLGVGGTLQRISRYKRNSKKKEENETGLEEFFLN